MGERARARTELPRGVTPERRDLPVIGQAADMDVARLVR
jgi:hypothetical protein